MARLHEYQGKAQLARAGVTIPRGSPASTPDQAVEIARSIGLPVIIKIQSWTTGRKSIGGVACADSLDDVADITRRLLRLKVGNFPVEKVLVEERLAIAGELFISLTIDDAARRPVLLLGLEGGTGIEDRAAHVRRIEVDIDGSIIDEAGLHSAIASSPTIPTEALQSRVVQAVLAVCTLARRLEARSIEINPLAITADGSVVAADCRMTIDDYAVFRHPELGIDIARELDHPPTDLERIAYRIEQDDHRGTFYFAQLPADPDKPLIGFHGAGGGGSMMSMDAVTQAGFTLANFADTSGNPSSAKVYRAARIILAQPGLVGYFGSGSGVASQEQYHSAYGLAKAFREINLSIPAVIRLGGNSEDRAVKILQDACADLPGTVEGYKKDDAPAFCAERFRTLVEQAGARALSPPGRRIPEFVGSASAYSFEITGGHVWINHARCDPRTTQIVLQHSSGLLTEHNGKPVLGVAEEDVMTKDSELIACEIECVRAGRPVVFVNLPIAGVDS